MKSQHTPGPWLVNYAEDRFDSKRSTIEIVDGSHDSLNHEQGPLVLAKLNVIPFAPHMDEPMANAYLIASAPELLAALEKAIEHIEDIYLHDGFPAPDFVTEFRSLIAKANGDPKE